jgi:hypothetical protein
LPRDTAPLSTKPADIAKEEIRALAKLRVEDPVSATTGALRVPRTCTSASEKLLWDLLMIMSEFDGSVSAFGLAIIDVVLFGNKFL